MIYRRTLRFSLRTAMLVMAIASVGCAILSHRIKSKNQAITRVEELGGLIVYESPSPPGTPQQTPWGKLKDRPTAHFDALRSAQTIVFSDISCPQNAEALRRNDLMEVTDEDLNVLNDFPEVQRLSIYSDKVKHLNANAFDSLSCLRDLTLDCQNLEGQAMQSICLCKQLEHLSILGGSFTTEELSLLHNLRNLKSLYLSDVELTDDHIRVLCECEQLQFLTLDYPPSVSEEAIEALRKKIPDANLLKSEF